MTPADDVYAGLPAAPGHAVGPARVVRVEGEPLEVPLGSILVVRVIHPYLAPLFFRVAGVVTEEGGLLQHATILAREFGIPAVVGLARATELFSEGQTLEVRGDSGDVVPLDG
jgi:phosphohistidine swiveling domain-containing protein